jgi:hypothetical protein
MHAAGGKPGGSARVCGGPVVNAALNRDRCVAWSGCRQRVRVSLLKEVDERVLYYYIFDLRQGEGVSDG